MVLGDYCNRTSRIYVARHNYGPQRQRWKMVYTRGAEVETTIYAGPSVERVTRPNGTLLFRHSISALGSTKAIVTRNGSSGAETVRYTLLDQQGSVDAFAEASGSVTRSSFTAFGERRNATTWSGAPSQAERDTLDEISRDGFTYQTVLGALGLNHMNGRVQDAVSGRFLSADPHVFSPLDSQGFNRYSYVYNNPLTNTDPSGFRTVTRTGTQCYSVPSIRTTISGPTVSSPIEYTNRPRDVPAASGPGRDSGRYSGPPHTPRLSYGPMVVSTQCVDYTYQVEVPDPQREMSWWEIAKNVANVAADFVPVVSSIKGAYEAYKVITDPNASTADKLIAAAGVLPYGKALKYGKKGLDAVKKIKSMSKACCFVAGTLVMTEDGLRPIEEIQVGERVLARNDETGETALKEVTALNRRAERDIWEVQVSFASRGGEYDEQTFETTDDHPWRTAGSEWVPTKELRIGDVVQRENGELARITLVSQAGRIESTYNLEVADFHSYFIGDAGIWVHNGACDISAKDLTNKTRSEIRTMAKEKGLVPKGDKSNPDYPRKFSDPQTGQERVRLDRGHVDKSTGKPYGNPNAAGDHAHGYDSAGNKVVDPATGDPHFPTQGE